MNNSIVIAVKPIIYNVITSDMPIKSLKCLKFKVS
jgi:hypothetical protein